MNLLLKSFKNLLVIGLSLSYVNLYAYTFNCTGTETSHKDDSKKPFTKNILIENDLSKINYKPAKYADNKQYIYTEEDVNISKNQKITIKTYFNPNFLTYSTTVEQDGKTLISTNANCQLLPNPFLDKK
ncbi:hypothetical protein L3V82_11380 [Thiotrichales bacterium 19S3-7]|nr:hypothetical protein [Thiotrichales bacterium 19S3-7]MCF6802815.1 hypothetical protein [Thiotrichales bacterium 19S3-11]